MIVYISGPITGVKNYRYKFNDAWLKLHEAGHIVFTPSSLPTGLPREKYMPICYSMIDASNAVYFLKGWKNSVGAQLEFDYAKKHEKTLLFEEEDVKSDYCPNCGARMDGKP